MQAGGWLGDIERDRQGQHASSSAISSLRYPSRWADQGRVLTAEQLWRIYQINPEVRSCVNGITRRVSTWDFLVEPLVDPSAKEYEAIQVECETAKTFLEAPNTDGETWQTLITKFVIDLLVFDAGAIEPVFSRKGDKLKELVALRGAEIRPVVDDVGHTLGYVQDPFGLSAGSPETGGPDAPRWDGADSLIFWRLFPTTMGPEGMPILESIVNEVITIIRASDHAMRALDADEIPPGILVLAGLDGNAAKAAKAEFTADKGKDHKIRILTTGNPNGIAASWIELRRTLKDLALAEVVKETKRTVWRAFGVLPIEQGETDGAPRASTETQLEIGSSHLLMPLLDGLEAIVNFRILPFLLSDKAKGKAKFYFDREARETATEYGAKAVANGSYVDNGTLTRNEVRELLGYAPIDGGDVPTVKVSDGIRPLLEALKPPPKPEPSADPFGGGPPAAPKDGKDPKPEEDGGVEPVEEEPEAAPGEADDKAEKSRRSSSRRGIVRVEAPVWRSKDGLPSDWQPEGRFKGMRTIELRQLGEVVIEYAKTVEVYWSEAEAEIQADVRAALADGVVTPEERLALKSRTSAALDKLATRWAIGTSPMYRQTARIARDSAVDLTGDVSAADGYETRGRIYGQRAMGWLIAPDGPIAAVRTKVHAVIDGQTRAVPRVEESLRGILGDWAGGIRDAFGAVEHRIGNWAGKLVDLAYEILNDGLLGSSPPPPPPPEDENPAPPPPAPPPAWWCEWVVVADSKRCKVCVREGNSGFRPVASLTVHPGAGTDCRANCRCVLTYWTEEEVRNGTAIPLNPSGGQVP